MFAQSRRKQSADILIEFLEKNAVRCKEAICKTASLMKKLYKMRSLVAVRAYGNMRRMLGREEIVRKTTGKGKICE